MSKLFFEETNQENFGWVDPFFCSVSQSFNLSNSSSSNTPFTSSIQALPTLAPGISSEFDKTTTKMAVAQPAEKNETPLAISPKLLNKYLKSKRYSTLLTIIDALYARRGESHGSSLLVLKQLLDLSFGGKSGWFDFIKSPELNQEIKTIAKRTMPYLSAVQVLDAFNHFALRFPIARNFERVNASADAFLTKMVEQIERMVGDAVDCYHLGICAFTRKDRVPDCQGMRVEGYGVVEGFGKLERDEQIEWLRRCLPGRRCEVIWDGLSGEVWGVQFPDEGEMCVGSENCGFLSKVKMVENALDGSYLCKTESNLKVFRVDYFGVQGKVEKNVCGVVVGSQQKLEERVKMFFDKE